MFRNLFGNQTDVIRIPPEEAVWELETTTTMRNANLECVCYSCFERESNRKYYFSYDLISNSIQVFNMEEFNEKEQAVVR
jgi:hypothetical protein